MGGGNAVGCGTLKIRNLDSEQETRGLSGMSTLSRVASDDARREVVNNFNRRSANLQTLGTIAGAATRYGLDGGWSNPDMQQMTTSKDNPLGWSYDDHGYADPRLNTGVA